MIYLADRYSISISTIVTILQSKRDLDSIVGAIEKLPDKLASVISQAIMYLLYLAFFISVFLIVWGIIEWLSGWNEISGKKNIIRGAVLLIIVSTLAI